MMHGQVLSSDFDYIVVGAGSAGCVVANRLSEDPSNRVALIEAGPSDRTPLLAVKTALPIGNIFILSNPKYNWNYEFRGGPSINGRRIPVPRGKLFGGCSSLNGAVYARGHSDDYDAWAAAGNYGWSYEQVLPFFKEQENWRGADAPEFHAKGGELDVSIPRELSILSRAYLDAAREAGYPIAADTNGAVAEGFEQAQVNQRNGVRMSSSRAFLHPVLGRPNLRVFDETMALRLLFEGKRAVALEIDRRGKREILRAGREIILSGGTVNSAQLLLLSGIGPSEELARHGIVVVHELPGVGANLHDHPTVMVAMEDRSRQSYALSLGALPRIAASPFKYLINRTGMLASNAVETRGYVRSLPELDKPDIVTGFIVGLKGAANVIPKDHGCVGVAHIARPKSRGRLRLASSNPVDKPIMEYDMLAERDDVDVLVRGIKMLRHILSMPALSQYLGRELRPGADAQSDAEIEAAVRETVATVYHPVGTCKMGPASDPLAVVDPELRVHGIEGLRVADASIMPTIIAGNTSAPAMMIGGRAAAFILGNRYRAGAPCRQGGAS